MTRFIHFDEIKLTYRADNDTRSREISVITSGTEVNTRSRGTCSQKKQPWQSGDRRTRGRTRTETRSTPGLGKITRRGACASHYLFVVRTLTHDHRTACGINVSVRTLRFHEVVIRL